MTRLYNEDDDDDDDQNYVFFINTNASAIDNTLTKNKRLR